eukprot:GHVT01073388.1.p1 GENE.GHVT01073388.1~~GHVT01073388.1.p1  ORF type:complete len:172 (+),score=10.03 GHVT01073388.1:1119-1634(+)
MLASFKSAFYMFSCVAFVMVSCNYVSWHTKHSSAIWLVFVEDYQLARLFLPVCLCRLVSQPRVSMVVSMLSHDLFRYQGHKGCALVLGGFDISGPSLYSVHPHGSTDRGPFATMGSGSLNAMAVLEKGRHTSAKGLRPAHKYSCPLTFYSTRFNPEPTAMRPIAERGPDRK